MMMVDRYSAYKAMAQVKLGNIVLAFCWAHVRGDFVKVGKTWPAQRVGVGLAPPDPRPVPPTPSASDAAGSAEFAAADATATA